MMTSGESHSLSKIATRARLGDRSSQIEKIVEYRLLADILGESFRQGHDVSVLRDDVDRNGRDVALETSRLMRHIQLKAMVDGGARRAITINTALAARRSACIIWVTYKPDTFEISAVWWFGARPGEVLPDLGSAVALHTRRNRAGQRQERRGHRIVSRSRFEKISGVAELVERLFGTPLSAERDFLLTNIAASDDAPWLREVSAGRFSAIPADLRMSDSAALAHLIDGYALAEQLALGAADEFLEHQTQVAFSNGRWPGDATRLWITLFLRHRYWRFADEAYRSEVDTFLEDLLCRQLREALVTLERAG